MPINFWKTLHLYLTKINFYLLAFLLFNVAMALIFKNEKAAASLGVWAFYLLLINLGLKLFRNNQKDKFDIIKSIKNNPGLYLLLVLGLISLTWFDKESFIAGGDNTFYLNPVNGLKNYLSTWDDHINLGAPNLQIGVFFPFIVFWKLFQWLGWQDYAIQRLWLYLIFTLPGIFIYWLIKSEIIKKEFPAFLGALLYMFNIFAATDVAQFTVKPVHAFLPLMLMLWIKALKQKRNIWFYPSLISITSIFLASSATNPSAVGVIVITLLTYLIFRLMFYPRKIKTILTAIIACVLVIVSNFWWLSTSFINMFKANKDIQQVSQSISFIEKTPLLETFRFMGYWAFGTTTKSHDNQVVPLVPYAGKYYTWPILFTSFLILAIAIFGFAFSKKPRLILLFFLSLTLLGVFLTKGSGSPAGPVYVWLYKNLPGFWIFRNPYSKFTLIHLLAISVILAWSSYKLYLKLGQSKVTRLIFKMFLVIIILINAWPILTGEAVQDEKWYNDPIRSLKVRVPDYWLALNKWSKEKTNSDDLIMLLPQMLYGHCLNWQPGICGGDPAAASLIANNLIKSPFLPFRPSELFLQKLYQQLLQPEIKLKEVLNLLSVKYILQQNDFYFEKYKNHEVYTPSELKQILTQERINEPLADFDQLKVYANSDQPSALFSPTTINNSFQNNEDIFNYILSDKFNKNELLVNSQYLPNGVEIKPVQLEVKKNSPALYRVKSYGNDETNNFIVILNQAYDDGWQLNSAPPIKSIHFPAFGFLNGWLITEGEPTMAFNLEYTPQKIFFYSLLVSITTVVILILAIIYQRFSIIKKH